MGVPNDEVTFVISIDASLASDLIHDLLFVEI